MTLTRVHAYSPLVPSTSTAAGAMIDNVRDECGLLIRGIDWACRLFGFDSSASSSTRSPETSVARTRSG